MLRRVIREELRKDADRKSYAAAGGYIALKDMPDLTGMAIGTIYKLRMARRRAKEANRDAIFPPEYEPARGRVKFKIAEVQEWMERKQK